METRYLRINPADNVAVAIVDLHKGEKISVDGMNLVLREDIRAGHKVALRDIKTGENVNKYGFPIGHATIDIAQGNHIHSHNLKTNLEGVLDYTYAPVDPAVLDKAGKEYTFEGYVRKSGEVGVRNEIWIVPTVGCVNGIADTIVDSFKSEVGQLPENIDAVCTYKHNYGCSQLGDDHENTRKILRDIVLHPNAAGVLVLGLGCENNQVSTFRELLSPDIDPERIFFLECQRVGDEVEESLSILRRIYQKAMADKRTQVPFSKLRIGLKCGGSDGFSGITANPLLGVLSDYIVAKGGTSVLSEVPEMFGAETQLMNRCVNAGVFGQTVHLINDFKEYFIKNNQPVYENPSPGNKEGGITTLEEKSLGCIQKGGKAKVIDVLKYGERIHKAGLNLLSAPGNDLVASTALGAAGCQMVLFTTGRGTPFGSFVPTVKISTNSTLFKNKSNWIDFNAGALLEGKTMEVLLHEFIAYLAGVASGKKTKSERAGYKEISIFKTGVTL